MSLINQMLSDLDQRRPVRSADSDRALEGVQSLGGRSQKEPQTKSPTRLPVAALIGIVTACLAWYGLKLIDRGSLPGQTNHSHRFEQLQPITVAERKRIDSTLDMSEEALIKTPEPVVTLATVGSGHRTKPLDLTPSVRLDDAVDLAVVKLLEPVTAPNVARSPEQAAGAEDKSTVEYPGTMRVEPLNVEGGSAEQLTEALARSRQGRVADALIALAGLVEEYPDFIPAREAYAAELLRRGDVGAAERILQSGLARTPQEPRYTLILEHILLQRDLADDALQLLLRAAPSVHEDVEYHAFIAALQQRLGMHDAAVDVYRRVLAQAPYSGVWWLGLAISLAAQDQGPEAHTAFQRALVDRDLSANLRQYANREISRLSGKG